MRKRRDAAGLTQERAAALAGITRNALSNIEKAQFPNPTLSTLLALMRTYQLGTVDELLGDTPAEVTGQEWSATSWEGGTPRPLRGPGA